MAYRFLNPAPVYFDLAGTAIAANGSLTFYDIGTTTPKNTFSDEAGVTPNTNPVSLDAAGRANTNIFLSGDYTVLLKDALGTTVWTKDVYDAASGGTTIPSLVSGEYLTNDGINLQWGGIRQVPDPTGSANKVLGTDGANLIWVNQTAIPDPDISNTATRTVIGDGSTKVSFLRGTATGVNAGGRTQSISVTFANAFSATPFVCVELTNASGLSTSGNNPSSRVTSVSTTGFTVVWTMGELDDSQSQYDFNTAVQMSYLAIGTVTS